MLCELVIIYFEDIPILLYLMVSHRILLDMVWSSCVLSMGSISGVAVCVVNSPSTSLLVCVKERAQGTGSTQSLYGLTRVYVGKALTTGIWSYPAKKAD